ncbi:MAG TPA: 2-amino-4-hydroxy-6-hydroxymethyldihydropteridine diphosphokinase [Ignavibacteria bacterium]|nr:2-amino-4-hydroxy-6-hydroxymethyldihydropteridine diphosphokinase [Ignavibacteria bacterium]
MVKAYLGIGSNIGERISYIENAISEINKISGIKITKISSVYETEPWGEIKQDDFLNCVIEIEADIEPEGLLKKLKSIEKKLGRNKTAKWSEREIDIDLLFYGNEILLNEFLKIPHLQIEKRKFVLIPMAEIASDFIHPVLKKSVKELLAETTDDLKVIKYQTSKV